MTLTPLLDLNEMNSTMQKRTPTLVKQIWNFDSQSKIVKALNFF